MLRMKVIAQLKPNVKLAFYAHISPAWLKIAYCGYKGPLYGANPWKCVLSNEIYNDIINIILYVDTTFR